MWSEEYWNKWYKELDKHIFIHGDNIDRIEIGSCPLKTKDGWLLINCRIQNHASSNRIFAIEAYLLDTELGQAVGYAIILETYSSFLALPTMYLEDIFVLESHRGNGFGRLLFDFVVGQARQRGCGRVDWQVLDWNTTAREFYTKQGAVCMNEWLLYRITL